MATTPRATGNGPTHDPPSRCGTRSRPPRARGRRRSTRQRVDPRADDGQQGRQRDDRRRPWRQQHDGDAGVGERAQEVLREHQQRGQRHRHGERADGDRPTGRLDGAHDRGLDAATGAQLLAVPGHDEQAVVDGQAETERRREVDGVDRHVGDRADHVQRQERAERRRARRRTAAARRRPGRRTRTSRSSSVIGMAIISARAEVALDRRADVGEDRLGSRRPRPRSRRSWRCGRGRAMSSTPSSTSSSWPSTMAEDEGAVAAGAPQRRR